MTGYSSEGKLRTETLAEEVARLMGYDGGRWCDDDGCDIEMLSRDRGARYSHCGDCVTYTFPDHSMITCSVDGWSIEDVDA